MKIEIRQLPDDSGYIANHLWGIFPQYYDERLRQVCRSIPGMTWSSESRAWIGYIDAVDTAARLLGFAGGFKPREFVRDLGGYGDLREYQKEGVRWLCEHADEGCILADDLGLGKSCQALRTAKALNARTLIVCPAYVKGHWVKQVEQWWGGRIPIVCQDTKPAISWWGGRIPIVCQGTKPAISWEPSSVVAIINYDILHAWAPLLKNWLRGGLVIFDEGQFLQEASSRRSKAAKEIAGVADYRIVLTGTPMMNRPKDLWNLVDTISPGRFGRPFNYRLRYCDAKQVRVTPEKIVWDYTGSSNLEELGARMKYFMLRRLKSEVMADLPELTRQILTIQVKNKFRAPIGPALADDAALRQALDLSADGKIPDAVNLAASHVQEGHSVIVFTHRRAVAEQIADGLSDLDIRAGFIHGGLSQTNRDVWLKSARENAKTCPITIACTIDSTGVGIDLSFADVCLFAELDWVPSKIVQAEGRLHRFGQKRPVLSQFLIGEGTIDELVIRSLLKKIGSQVKVIGRSDDMLESDLRAAQKSGAQALREMWQSMQAGA